MLFFLDNDTYFGSEVHLINSLFANYNKQARPVLNVTTTVDVNISLTVMNILGIVRINYYFNNMNQNMLRKDLTYCSHDMKR